MLGRRPEGAVHFERARAWRMGIADRLADAAQARGDRLITRTR